MMISETNHKKAAVIVDLAPEATENILLFFLIFPTPFLLLLHHLLLPPTLRPLSLPLIGVEIDLIFP
jgi:hypothetical protein